MDDIGDEFLAYIDDVLGPLPADAEILNQDTLGTVAATAGTSLAHTVNIDAGGLNVQVVDRANSPAAQTGRARLGERLNSRWSPKLGLRSESKARDGSSSQRHT